MPTTTAAGRETFIYTTVDLPRWSATIPAAYPKGNRREVYLLFRAMCETVGVERKRQLAVIKHRYASACRMLPLEMPSGAKPAIWVRAGECGLWVGGINPARTRLETRDNLTQFQADLKEAAERVLFAGAHKPSTARGMFAHSERMEYVFSCLACGAGHRIIAQNGEVTLERYEF